MLEVSRATVVANMADTDNQFADTDLLANQYLGLTLPSRGVGRLVPQSLNLYGKPLCALFSFGKS